MANPSDKLSPTAFATLLVVAALTFYFVYTYTGPYQWIAELQLRWFESYSEKVTLILTGAMVFAAIGILILPFHKLALGKGTDLQKTIPDIGGAFVLAVVGMGFVVFGLFKAHEAETMGNFQKVSLAEMEHGHAPPSLYVTVEGYPLLMKAISFGETGHSKDTYTPFTSGGAFTPGGGIAVFLKVDPEKLPNNDGGLASLSGVLSKNDLPGPVRTHMQQARLLANNDYYVLEVGETPESKKTFGFIMAIVGAVMAAIALIVFLVQRKRRLAVQSDAVPNQ